MANGGLDADETEVTDELGVAGTPQATRQQLQEIIEMDVIDFPIVHVPRSTTESVRDQTIEEQSPSRLSAND